MQTSRELPATFGPGTVYAVESHRLANGMFHFTRYLLLANGKRVELPSRGQGAPTLVPSKSQRRSGRSKPHQKRVPVRKAG
jgi:hypothetical protein